MAVLLIYRHIYTCRKYGTRAEYNIDKKLTGFLSDQSRYGPVSYGKGRGVITPTRTVDWFASFTKHSCAVQIAVGQTEKENEHG